MLIERQLTFSQTIPTMDKLNILCITSEFIVCFYFCKYLFPIFFFQYTSDFFFNFQQFGLDPYFWERASEYIVQSVAETSQ